MDFVLGLIDIAKILELPALVLVPGGILIFLFLVRAVRSLLTLRLITVFTSLVYALVIAIILSQAGDAIVQLIGLEDTPGQQSLVKPASPSDFRYTA